MKQFIFALLPLLLFASPTLAQNTKGTGMTTTPETGYASINGLELYYEIHGEGEPLVVLHGAYMTIETMGALIPELAKTRQVIAVETQGHGHTLDIDQPLSYEQMADDVAGLLTHLNIVETDVFGYSMGGGTALQLAVRHPEHVRKLIVASGSYKTEGIYPEVLAGLDSVTPEMFAGTPFEDAAARPEDFPELVRKLVDLDATPQAWPTEDMRGITSPALLIIGDADIIRPEHTVELFRLLGGGVPGDLTGLPKARLAVLPGTTHITVMNRTAWLLPMINEFLDAAPATSGNSGA